MEQRETMFWLSLGTVRAAPYLCRRAVCGLRRQRTSSLGDTGDGVSLYLQQARSAGMPRGRPSAMDLIPFSGVSLINRSGGFSPRRRLRRPSLDSLIEGSLTC